MADDFAEVLIVGNKLLLLQERNCDSMSISVEDSLISCTDSRRSTSFEKSKENSVALSTGKDCAPQDEKPYSKLRIDSSEAAVCRICQGSEFSNPVSGEPLISPCNCRGTVALCHRSCLEKWLSSSNTDKCELCNFRYLTERRPKSLFQFLLHPGSASIRRNLCADIACWIVLTPLAVASTWLCVCGAVHYSQLGINSIEVPGLICLAIFLLITYSVWLTVSIRYHTRIWQEWQRDNQEVKIKVVDRLYKDSSAVKSSSKGDEPNDNSGGSAEEKNQPDSSHSDCAAQQLNTFCHSVHEKINGSNIVSSIVRSDMDTTEPETIDIPL